MTSFSSMAEGTRKAECEDSKDQENRGKGVSDLLNNPSLPTVVLLFCSSEEEVDLVEG